MVNIDSKNNIDGKKKNWFISDTAVLMWYQQTYQVTNYVLQKRIFDKGASGD